VSAVVRLGRGLKTTSPQGIDFLGFQALGFSTHIFFSFVFSYFMVRRGDE
jgi:hypothetical protein